jgi:hypothetical protein
MFAAAQLPTAYQPPLLFIQKNKKSFLPVIKKREHIALSWLGY